MCQNLCKIYCIFWETAFAVRMPRYWTKTRVSFFCRIVVFVGINASEFRLRRENFNFSIIVGFLIRRQKRPVHKGAIQPNFCAPGKILLCASSSNLPSTWLPIFDREKISSFAAHSGNIFVLRKKWIFQICRNFHISTYLLPKWNIPMHSLGCPYFIYSIDRKQVNQELGSIFEIKIILKRCLIRLQIITLTAAMASSQ